MCKCPTQGIKPMLWRLSWYGREALQISSITGQATEFTSKPGTFVFRVKIKLLGYYKRETTKKQKTKQNMKRKGIFYFHRSNNRTHFAVFYFFLFFKQKKYALKILRRKKFHNF